MRALLPACLALLAAGCARGDGTDLDGHNGDGSFGTPPPEIDRDASRGNDDGADPDAGESNSQQVRLRVFHGALNLGGLRFCHDPDYRADDPHTPEDERDPGADPARQILSTELDGGVLPLGVATAYFELNAARAGAITVHRAPLPVDAGADANIALNLDAGRDGGLSDVDAGSLPPSDAGDSPAVDAGGDAELDAALDPCDPSSLEAVLPLPLSAHWLEPPRPPVDAGRMDGGPRDGGPSDVPPDAQPTPPERRGFTTTLSGDAPLTLFGSGRSLDPKEVAARLARAHAEYLEQHPGDEAGAQAASRALGAWLESTFGPRFLPARGPTPGQYTFALSFVHLVPDVPPAPNSEPGSGPLHMCVTVDTVESEPPDGGTARHEFRNVSSLGAPFDPRATYRFRLFVEADFALAQASCGVTSLKPVAELTVEKNTLFAARRSYMLVAWGARSPSDLCTAYPNDSVVRPGCARSAESLNARIEVLENELPPLP